MSVQTSDGVKAGWKTSEFWLTVLTGLGSMVGGMQGVISDNWAAAITATVTAAYAIARALTKKASLEAGNAEPKK